VSADVGDNEASPRERMTLCKKDSRNSALKWWRRSRSSVAAEYDAVVLVDRLIEWERYRLIALRKEGVGNVEALEVWYLRG
jgi:hypothetical protein